MVIREIAHSKTFNIGIKLFPDTKNVYVISGIADLSTAHESKLRAVLNEYKNKYNIHYLSNLSSEEILEKVSNLPEHSIIFQLILLKDKNGKKIIPKKVTREIAKRTQAPIFSLWNTFIGTGIVGGYVSSGEKQGSTIMREAISIIKDQKIAEANEIIVRSVPTFDWRQLKRWKIDNKDSNILFKQYTFFELHKKKIIFWFIVILLQAIVIVLLYYLLKKRKQAESESRFLRNYLSNIINSMPSIVVGLDNNGNVTNWNRKAEEVTGISVNNALGKQFIEVFPEMNLLWIKLMKVLKIKLLNRNEELFS